MSNNANLNRAKSTKDDEFYTCLPDVSKELAHYGKHFRDKTVLCNCNDTIRSAFWEYFHMNFSGLAMKRLIATSYDRTGQGYKFEYDGGSDSDIETCKITPLKENGDFRNSECIELLEQSDMAVTNPPFSLFREYVSLLVKHEKKFLIIGNLNACKYSECLPLIMDNSMWFGKNQVSYFFRPDGSARKFGNINWYTNLDFQGRHEKLMLRRKYNPVEYQKYDTFDAIDVTRVSEIPADYPGIMGVPLSFMYSYNPEQFRIVGEFNHGTSNIFDLAKPVVNGRTLYPRIAIQARII